MSFPSFLTRKTVARNALRLSCAIAFLALASFVPAAAFAQESIDLTPPTANNPFDTFHTVTAQTHNLGVCAERVPEMEAPDGEGNPCTADTECDGGGDDFCDYTGVKVGFRVTGTNAQDTNTVSTPNSSGVVTFTYHDDNGVGSDTIQACADLGLDNGETTGECIADSGGGEDVASGTVAKNWVPTLNLSPPGSFNPTGAQHTVTATLNGVPGNCTAGAADPCLTDAQCAALSEGTCNLSTSGAAIGFEVSGANGPIDTTVDIPINSHGQASFTYTGSSAGNDTIQACADLGGSDNGETTAICISEDAVTGSGDTTDIASNTSRKVWGAEVATLTPAVAFNPIGVQHVLTTTLSGFPNICSNQPNTCMSDADCSGVMGACGQAGYPVFFAVVGTCTGGNNGGATCTSNANCDSNVCTGGPNLGELGSSLTNSGGAATKSYTSAVEGQDKIQACVDADPDDLNTSPDDISFIECLNDSGVELDVPTNTVIKNWFANFVTGGGGVNVGSGAKKKNLQNSGIVGKAGLAGIQGDWESVSQVSGKTVACHFNTFTSLAFSGPAASSPPSTHNTATFTTGPGKCNDGSSPTLTVTIVDNGEGKKSPRDTLNVVSSDTRFATGATLPLATGNYQVHDITP
jgi:hypothetical protein